MLTAADQQQGFFDAAWCRELLSEDSISVLLAEHGELLSEDSISVLLAEHGELLSEDSISVLLPEHGERSCAIRISRIAIRSAVVVLRSRRAC
jgi:hypothetical protein